jgi:5-methylcytosine-specific restriction endonuclease McrA
MKTCNSCNTSKPVNEFYKNRTTKDGYEIICKECNKLKGKVYRTTYKEKISAQKKSYRQVNKEKVLVYRLVNREQLLAKKKEYYNSNKEKVLAQRKNYYNSNKEKRLTQMKLWRETNPDKVNAKTAKRRAQKLRATPPWLTTEDYQKIESFYILAKQLTQATEIPHEVDHIIPLQGKIVSGLHVPWNLQVIPAIENIKKGNRINL